MRYDATGRKYVYISRQRTYVQEQRPYVHPVDPNPEVAPPPETAAQAVRSQSAAPVAHRLGAGSLFRSRSSRPGRADLGCADVAAPPEAAAFLVFASVAAAGALVVQAMAYRRQRKIRHTVIRVIAAYLRGDKAEAWCGLDLDFTGAA